MRSHRPHLHDAAEIDHDDPVADVLDDAEVVRDEQHGEAELALQVGEQVDDLGLDRDVEGGYGLVGDDQFGLDGQRPGDDDALALAAGEFVRVAVDVLGGEADPLEDLDRTRPLAAARARDRGSSRLRPGCRSDRHARVEARKRVLEDDLHAPAIGAHGRAVEVGDVDAVEADAAGGRAPSGAGRRGRWWSCRSRIRRRGRRPRLG